MFDNHRNLILSFLPFETQKVLENICSEYNKVIGNIEVEPLIAIPIFIHDFLCIHTFNDGNGIISRLLTTLLYRSGFYVGKYISLEALIAKNKPEYYNALEKAGKKWQDGEEDVLPFVKYLLSTIRAAYKTFEDRFSIMEEKLPAVEKEEPVMERSVAPVSNLLRSGLVRSGGTRATETTDLNQMTQSIEMVGIEQTNGVYLIQPNTDYRFKLKFKETEEMQFANEQTLIYKVPDNIKISQGGKFTMTVIDNAGTLEIPDNTFEVKVFPDGHREIHVNFNKNHPEFVRLKAVGNAQFQLEMTGRIEKTTFDQQPFTVLDKTFQYEIKAPEIGIDKEAKFDKKTSTANYTVTVRSTAENQNLVIKDELKGTALTFNKDVKIVSNKNGVLPYTPTYNNKGFEVTIPKVVDGEVLTLTYSAKVDPEGIVGSGSSAQLKNIASAHSDQAPDVVTAEKNVPMDFAKVYKEVAEETKPLPNNPNLYRTKWWAYFNKDHVQTVGGKTISDNIEISSGKDFADGGKRVYFVGTGIKLKVKKSDGSEETRNIPWSQLETTKDVRGHIIAWKYKAPASDGKAYYKFEAESEIDITDAGIEVHVKNHVTDGLNSSDAYTTAVVPDPGIPGQEPDILKVEKTATHVSATKVSWEISINVGSKGYDEFNVQEFTPKSSDGKWHDDFDLDSIKVDGLLPGETYTVTPKGEPSGDIVLQFYKDAAKTQKGLLPSGTNKPRKLTIKLDTKVNQTWLQAAHDTNYEHKENHKNALWLATDLGGLWQEHTVIPKKQTVKKKAIDQTIQEVNGIKFPVFNYYIEITNPTDGDIINDVYSKEFLAFVKDASFRAEAYDKDGNKVECDHTGSLNVQEINNGSSIILADLPKKDGKIQYKYKIYYSLRVKDVAALEKLNGLAFQQNHGYPLNNIATFNDLSSENTVQNYQYSPVIDKKLIKDPTTENGYIARYGLVLNENAGDMSPGSNSYEVSDKLSDNLRFKANTVSIEPADAAAQIQVGFDSANNKVTFKNVPDNKRVVIEYEATVLGAPSNDVINISNTVEMLGYHKEVEKEVNIASAGSGAASNPSITIMKRDADTSTGLQGAKFKLVRINNGQQEPVKDKNGNEVFFTTGADGKVLIEGNQETLGWVLREDKEYGLVEVTPPKPGYKPLTEPVKFTLKERPENQTHYTISGDVIDVYNEREKTEVEVEKIWEGVQGSHPTVWFKLYRKIQGGNEEEVPAAEAPVKALADGESKVKWTGLYKKDIENNEYTYSVKEVDKDGNPKTPAGYTNSVDGFKVTNKSKEGSWKPEVTKKLEGMDLEADKFEFELKEGGNVLQTVKNKADGSIPFTDINYTAADLGEHTYTITEKKPNPALPGITYDTMTVTYKVKVEDKGEAKLTVTVTEEPTDKEFNNKAATGSWKPVATKAITGKTLADDMFEFELKEGGNVLQTVKNKADGSIPFKDINYTAADLGEHTYTITEKAGSLGGVTYDNLTITYKVKVADKGDGTLEAKVENPPADTEFNNKYAAKGSWTPVVTKKLIGRTLLDDEFEFELKKGSDSIETVKNKADGSIPFKAINYTLADVGEHTYTITEKAGSLVGVTYDNMTVTYKVKVSDNGDGTLKTEVIDPTPADTEFNNNFGIDVTFSKVALGQGNELEGAKLTVKKADGTEVETWESTGTAKIIKLPVGEYKMIEDQAPLGYDIAAEIEFRVNADGTVEVKQGNGWINAADAKIQMVDELTKRDVFFSKTTLGQGNELKGAKITVSGTDANGQAFNESWISDGAAKELKLKAGEYTMVEDQAPLGYDKAATITFKVELDGKIKVKEGENWIDAADAKIQMIDELTKYDVNFSKVEAGQGQELKGAKITVSGKDIDGGLFIESWISDGTAKKLKLKAGEYKMIEDQAPLGYDKAAEIIFRVNKDGSVDIKKGSQWIAAKDAKVQMVDELIKKAPEKKVTKGPETGDSNNIEIWMTVMLIATLAVLGGVYFRRRNKSVK